VSGPGQDIRIIEHLVSQMQKGCSVRKSPYCHNLVSMRMQGSTFGELAVYLLSKGEDFAIPVSTLSRNLKMLEKENYVPCATLLIETWGGSRNVDLLREIENLIHLQKVRVDRVVRREQRLIAGGRPDYIDRNVKEEMSALGDLIKIRKALDVVELPQEEERRQPVQTTQLGKDTLANLILGDDLVVDQGWLHGETVH